MVHRPAGGDDQFLHHRPGLRLQHLPLIIGQVGRVARHAVMAPAAPRRAASGEPRRDRVNKHAGPWAQRWLDTSRLPGAARFTPAYRPAVTTSIRSGPLRDHQPPLSTGSKGWSATEPQGVSHRQPGSPADLHSPTLQGSPKRPDKEVDAARRFAPWSGVRRRREARHGSGFGSRTPAGHIEGTCARDTPGNGEKDREADSKVNVPSDPERLIESPVGQFVNNCSDPAGARPATAPTPSAPHPPQSSCVPAPATLLFRCG